MTIRCFDTKPKEDMRSFNTEGQCIPALHYMVKLDRRLQKVKQLIDRQNYLYIKKARQYGKTTLLMALRQYLQPDYAVVFLDFQGLSNAQFASEAAFCHAFTKLFCTAAANEAAGSCLPETVLHAFSEAAENGSLTAVGELAPYFTRLCSAASRPVVLLIDEVDSATNNQVFLDFLSQLRMGYINRLFTPTFQSVILAGVYDIKNLKLKIRPETEHDRFNSPWNIAAKFNVAMEFSSAEIAIMLEEYKADHHTGMDISSTAQLIFDYTAGYPYLVSAICKLLDEDLPAQDRFQNTDSVWTEEGISEAVKLLLKEDLPLFGSIGRQLDRFPDLKTMIRNVLFRGQQIPFSTQVESISMGLMFGYLKEKDGLVCIANRIFEMMFQNQFLAETASGSEAYQAGLRDKNQFIRNGRLDMDRVMQKFVQFYGDVFADKDEKYLENFGREIFLMYLKPIINGCGNSYQESTTRTMTRTDLIVDYLGEQFVIECKIWRGQEYNKRGEEQLLEYLDFYHKNKGYLLSFNFNRKKTPGIREIRIGDKLIVEAVV